MRELTFAELASLSDGTPVKYNGPVSLQPVDGVVNGSIVEESSGDCIVHIEVPPLAGSNKSNSGFISVRESSGHHTGVFVED